VRLARSFKARVGIAVFLASLIPTLVTSSVFLNQGSSFAEKELLTEARSLAELLTATCAAALAFNDEEYAKELLKSVEHHQSVSSICLYDNQNRLFVSITKTAGQFCENPISVIGSHGTHQKPGSPGLMWEGHQNLTFAKDVVHRGTKFGTLVYEVSKTRIEQIRTRMIGLSIAIFTALFLLLTVPITILLNKLLAAPVNALILSAKDLPDPQKPATIGDLDEVTRIAGSIQRLREYVGEVILSNVTLKSKMDSMLASNQFAKKAMRMELSVGKKISIINYEVAKDDGMSVQDCIALFDVAKDHFKNMESHFFHIDSLTEYLKEHADQLPSRLNVGDVFIGIYLEHFGKFGQDSFVIENVDKAEVILFSDALHKFIGTFFYILEHLAYPEDRVFFSMLEEEALGSQNHRTFSMRARFEGKFSEESLSKLESLLPAAEDSMHDELRSAIESLVYYANLNANAVDTSPLKLLINKGTLEIQFKLFDFSRLYATPQLRT